MTEKRIDGSMVKKSYQQPHAPWQTLCNLLRPPSFPKPLPHDPAKLSRYVEAAYSRELEGVRLAPRGGRNARLFKGAAALGSFIGAGLLPIEHVRESLMQAAELSGLANEDGIRVVRATIESGLMAGIANPRPLPEGVS